MERVTVIVFDTKKKEVILIGELHHHIKESKGFYSCRFSRAVCLYETHLRGAAIMYEENRVTIHKSHITIGEFLARRKDGNHRGLTQTETCFLLDLISHPLPSSFFIKLTSERTEITNGGRPMNIIREEVSDIIGAMTEKEKVEYEKAFKKGQAETTQRILNQRMLEAHNYPVSNESWQHSVQRRLQDSLSRSYDMIWAELKQPGEWKKQFPITPDQCMTVVDLCTIMPSQKGKVDVSFASSTPKKKIDLSIKSETKVNL
jgi:hypothetical protein